MTRLVLHFLGSKISSASINHMTNTCRCAQQNQRVLAILLVHLIKSEFIQGRICTVLKLFLIAHGCLRGRSVSPRMMILRPDEYCDGAEWHGGAVMLISQFMGRLAEG